MEEITKQINKMLETLGFTPENAVLISDRLITAILEDVYYTMLPEDQITLLKGYVEKGDIEQIKLIASKLDQNLFAANVQASTQKIVSEFLKQIVDTCPEGMLDELQAKLTQVQALFPQPQTAV